MNSIAKSASRTAKFWFVRKIGRAPNARDAARPNFRKSFRPSLPRLPAPSRPAQGRHAPAGSAAPASHIRTKAHLINQIRTADLLSPAPLLQGMRGGSLAARYLRSRVVTKKTPPDFSGGANVSWLSAYVFDSRSFRLLASWRCCSRVDKVFCANAFRS
jgi:hypothetical protein